MGLIQSIRNISKQAWYNRDEWVNTEEFYVTETIEKHGCPSWDVGLCKLKHYKHKDSCEERWRLVSFALMANGQITETVFDDPTEEQVSFGWPDVEAEHIDNLDVTLYEGDKYE